MMTSGRPYGGEMLEAEDCGVVRHQPLGEEMMDAPRQRIRRVEGPVRAFVCEALTQTRERVSPALGDRALECLANAVHRARASRPARNVAIAPVSPPGIIGRDGVSPFDARLHLRLVEADLAQIAGGCSASPDR